MVYADERHRTTVQYFTDDEFPGVSSVEPDMMCSRGPRATEMRG